MKCPIDNANLAITERQGVEIDYCPLCRGVWLDRGELDKIIEKSELASAVTPVQKRYESQPPQNDDYRREHDDKRYPNDHYKKKKRESFLGDLFDF